VLGAGAAAVALIGANGATAQTIGDAIAGGKPILEVRPRFEAVDQANLAQKAEAFTVRTRLGWETAAWNNLKGLIEFEDVRQLGGEHYNTTINGKTAYPVIADPDVTELNRLQVTWTPSKQFGATLGRQRINFDDQRFIGAVGWRQDEQTFDAVRADLAVAKAKVAVVYVDHVNRVFAEDLDWDSQSWLVNASYAGPAIFQPSAFVYALDFDNAPGSSSLTAGLRVTGSAKAGDILLAYSASAANQKDHGDNPADFSLDYRQAEVAGTLGVATLRATYESLEGNGVRGFATPLATLHAFQGWADVFLTTPPNGIDDIGATLVVRPPIKLAYLSGVQLTARFHDFTAERGGADLGEELDLMAQAAFTPRLSGFLKYADYDGAPGFSSRTKVWLGFEFKL
jgi:hypothetical protein